MKLEVIASDNVALPLDELAKTFNLNGDNTVNYIQVTYGPNTYRQTFTYSGGYVTSVTGWVKQ